MIFSDLYKSPRSPLSKLRNSLPHAVPLPPDFDADLVSKDKNRQKEAVRKYLANKVRNDWAFVWPPVVSSPLTTPPDEDTIMVAPEPSSQNGSQIATENTESNINSAPPANDEDAIARDPGEEADSEADAESVYSTVSEDPAHFRARAEWTSDLSDDDEPIPGAHSPYRFDSPDAVGTVVQSTMMARRKRRRKAIREESKWNPGLACFEARRDAWTGAKTVRVKPKPPSPASPPASPRRLQIWRHRRTSSTPSYAAVVTGALPPHNDVAAITPPTSDPETATHNTKGSTSTVEEEEGTSSKASEPRVLYPVETLLPLPPPLLPPQNPMRASVTPSIYPSLYDKIVVNNLQPSCPVNLSDMLRACVAGWKRDGEWPPRPAVAPMPTASELAAMRHHQRRSNAAIGTATASASRVTAAQQRQQQHARNGSTATNGSTTRRMSFVGFLSGNKDKEKDKTENKTTEGEPLEKVKTAKDGSNSEEGSGGKSSIRRSLQKVFSLGSHGSHHSNQPASPPAADGTAPAAAG
ncbi:hypothetical protein QBC46DRAFT_377385 [Diplogelasinospora grovesii]|uniref:Gag1-like clamp domain-containing protein n=1 Tax=Diplogelasinospora grovesii TaxID=303347 RepID=A0AAN6ND42_9PEZI|nr:hypothetical protein QBC46DRAFT_377385 [Diplogelasinospora grovesii]